jgi:hypothetical protein
MTQQTHTDTQQSGAPAAAHDPAEFTLARNPEKAMKQMLRTIDDLGRIYTRENDALSQSDTKTFLELQDKKIQTATIYQKGIKQMMDRKDEFDGFSEEFKRSLSERQKAFNALAEENLTSIKRTQKTVQRLNERIMNSAREEAATKNVNYKNNGQLGTNERPVSMGVSESV